MDETAKQKLDKAFTAIESHNLKPVVVFERKTMKVKIKKTCKSTGVKEGEMYEAIRYHLDPLEKVTLLKRIPDGYDPECNEYLCNVEIVSDLETPLDAPCLHCGSILLWSDDRGAHCDGCDDFDEEDDLMSVNVKKGIFDETNLTKNIIQKASLRKVVDTLKGIDILLAKSNLAEDIKDMALRLRKHAVKAITKKIHQFLLDWNKPVYKSACGINIWYRGKLSKKGFLNGMFLHKEEDDFTYWCSSNVFDRVEKDEKFVEFSFNHHLGSDSIYYDIDGIDRFYKWFLSDVSEKDIRNTIKEMDAKLKLVNKGIQFQINAAAKETEKYQKYKDSLIKYGLAKNMKVSK